MVCVKLREGESFEYAIRKFKRIIEKAGFPKEWRNREHFVKPSKTKQLNKAAAYKRLLKRLSKDRFTFSNNPNKGAGRRRPSRVAEDTQIKD